MSFRKPHPRAARIRTSYDAVATHYDHWVGARGSLNHQRLVLPAVLDLLAPQSGEHILDLGAGQGVLAPAIARAGARYTGVDASARLLRLARQRHGRCGTFVHGDAADLPAIDALRGASYDGAVFLLSIQDMEPLDAILRSTAWALRPGGRVVVLMNHPCFRVPRQSGWGWDQGRKLRFRRIDRYLSALPVPIRSQHRAGGNLTHAFHRPLEAYVNGLAEHGMLADQLREIASDRRPGARPTAEEIAAIEIPLFLALRAWKLRQ